MYMNVCIGEKIRLMGPDEGPLLRTLAKNTDLQGQCLVTAHSLCFVCIVIVDLTPLSRFSPSSPTSTWAPFLWRTWTLRRACALYSSSCGHCR